MSKQRFRRGDHLFGSAAPMERITVAAAVAAALMAPAAIFAQTADATLAGYATPNATVTVHNTATGFTRHGTAGGDGRYVIPGLPPGDYTVDAGGTAQQTVTLQVATTTTLDLLEQVTITGGHPVHQEAITSEVGQVVSLHDIENLPQYTRNFLEFANQVPGMQFQVDSQGNTSLRGGAQLTSNVNVYIDGVSQKDYVFGGITGQEGPGQAGDPGNPFPQLAIDEYKVITSNYKAEFGDAASAIIVAQTRSGTNQFAGESFLTWTNQNLRAETPAEAALGQPKTTAPSWEFGAAEGGPIIPDVMHFFVTFERKTLSEQNVVYPGGGVAPATADAVLPAGVSSQFGPTTNPFSEDLGFAKIDLEPTQADRFELTAKLRDERQLQGASGQTAASAASHYENDDNRYMLLWTHSWSNVLNELRVTHQSTTSNTNAEPSPQFDYFYYPVVNSSAGSQNLINVGGPGAGVGFRYDQRGTGVQEDLTFTGLTDHTIKVGANFQSVDLLAQAGTLSLEDAVYYEAASSAGLYANPYEVQFPVSFAGSGAPSVTSTDQQFALYLQDDWTVNRNLTINAGVRWDYEKVPLFDNYVTPAGVVQALNSPGVLTNGYSPNLTYAQLLAKSFPGDPATNINDYISTGSNRKPPTDDIAPRLGFAWDIDADQSKVVFGGYGRSYDRNLFNTLSYETTKVGLYNNPQIYFPSPYTQDSFGPCATAANVNPAQHCYAWNPAYLTAAGLAGIPVSTSSHEVDMINNNIKTPYSDQFSIGYRTRLADWDAAITLSDIKSYDALVGHLGNRYPDGSYYSNQGAPWGASGPVGYGSLILWDNAGEDENQQVTISFTKPYTAASGWSASFAYTYSNAYQNNVAGPLNPYAGSPNAYLFDLPNPKDYPLEPSTAVPRHRLVSAGSYDLGSGWTVSGKAEVSSATYLDTILGLPCPTATPPAVAHCNQFGGNATPINVKIPNAIGYKDIDVSLAKAFDIWGNFKGTVRFDVLNLFNWSNFDPNAAIWTPAYGAPMPQPYYNLQGPIIGFPRTLRLTGQLSW